MYVCMKIVPVLDKIYTQDDRQNRENRITCEIFLKIQTTQRVIYMHRRDLNERVRVKEERERGRERERERERDAIYKT